MFVRLDVRVPLFIFSRLLNLSLSIARWPIPYLPPQSSTQSRPPPFSLNFGKGEAADQTARVCVCVPVAPLPSTDLFSFKRTRISVVRLQSSVGLVLKQFTHLPSLKTFFAQFLCEKLFWKIISSVISLSLSLCIPHTFQGFPSDFLLHLFYASIDRSVGPPVSPSPLPSQVFSRLSFSLLQLVMRIRNSQ